MLDLYCERIIPGFWAEPVNAATNVGSVLVAWLVWRLTLRARLADAGITTLIGLIVAIAMGSFLFHTLATPLARWLDLLPIIVFQLCYLWIYCRRLIALSPAQSGLLLLLFMLSVATAMQFSGVFNGSLIYAPALLVILLLGWYQYRRLNIDRGLLLAAAGVFSLSILLRSADIEICPHFATGTHFLWHLLNALVVYLVMRSLVNNLSVTPGRSIIGDAKQ